MSEVCLISNDHIKHYVSKDLLRLSNLIQTIIDEDSENEDDDCQEIPLPNISSSILLIVINFLKYYQIEPMSTIPQPLPSSDLSNILQAWYYDFIRSYSLEIQFQLILAANYLDIKPLLDLSCAIIASQIKGKTIQEIRDHFHIVNDFTLIEEEQIREEMKWCDVTLPEN